MTEMGDSDVTKSEDQLKAAIKRKDELLEKALKQLVALEWEVSLGLIIEIQKELGGRFKKQC